MRYKIILLSILISSCATTSNPAKQLSIGMNVSEVEKVLGPAESAAIKDYGKCKVYRYRASYNATPSIAVRYEDNAVTAFGSKACTTGT